MKRLLFLLLISNALWAQQTGSFHHDYLFNDANFNQLQRRFAYYIPSDLDSNLNHPVIIGLPGCGSSVTGFRNNLQGVADSLNALLVVVDAGGNWINDEFNGKELKLIEYAFDSIKNYGKVDELAVYLTGFSCNGREALKIVLEQETSVPFAGVIPYAGAFNNTNFNPSSFSRSAVSPVCLCMGTSDFFYTSLLFYGMLVDSLDARNANYKEVLMPGVGHTTIHAGFDDAMLECFEFLKNNTTIGHNDELKHEGLELMRYGANEYELRVESADQNRMELYSLSGELICKKAFVQKVGFQLHQPGIYVLSVLNSSGKIQQLKVLR